MACSGKVVVSIEGEAYNALAVVSESRCVQQLGSKQTELSSSRWESKETSTLIEENPPVATFRTCLWLFLVLLAVRLVISFIFKRDLSNDDCEVDRVAFSLSGHMGFANPFKIPTGPTSHVAPAYPFILAGIYELWGRGSLAEAVRQILSCSATCLQFALLPSLAATCNMRVRVGVLGALLGGLLPLRHWIETKGTFEAPYTALLLVILTILTVRLWRLGQPSWRRAWTHGLTWGLALLFTPTLLPVLSAYLVLGAFRYFREHLSAYLRYSAGLLCAVAIVMAPWTIRNYLVFHHLIFVRGNFGLELNLSNNDSALPLFEQNLKTTGFQTNGPLTSLSAAQEVERLGEAAYYHQQLQTAREWIGSHPREFVHLTIYRVRYFWFPPLEAHARGFFSSLTSWCLTLTAIVALLIMMRNHRWPALAIAAIWLTYPVVYYLLQFDLRYRYPIEWTFLFGTSYTIVVFLDRAMHNPQKVLGLGQNIQRGWQG